MVTVTSTPREPEDRPWLRDFSSEQSAVIEQALAGPDDDGTRYACDVAELLRDLNLDHECVAAAILHTRRELGACPFQDVGETFGPAIGRLVRGLEKMDAIDEYRHAALSPGKDRKQLERVKSLLLAMVEDVRVVLIKLAECLVRMRHLREREAAERADMARASLDVYAPLASRLGIRHCRNSSSPNLAGYW